MAHELLALGGAYVDINCSDFPFGNNGLQPETEVVGDNYYLEPGGSAPNFTRLCASLEVPTTFIGKVGDDTMGHLFADLMRSANVNPALIVDPLVQTSIGMNVVNAAGKSIMTVAGNANQSMRSEEVEAHVEKLLPGSSYLYLGGCFKLKALLPALGELARLARAQGVKTVLDHGRLTNTVTAKEKEAVRNLACEVDYYLPSEGELKQLWGVSSSEEGLRNLAKIATGTVIVKQAEKGAITLQEGRIITAQAFPVQPIHTVGAGDSFNAGFIAAARSGMNISDSMQFACATAALKLSQEALPTRTDVENYLKNA